VKELLNAYDPDVIDEQTQALLASIPKFDQSPALIEQTRNTAQATLSTKAAKPFTGELNEYLENVRKIHEQLIDHVNQDSLLKAEWDTESTENAQQIVQDFSSYIEANKDEITALSILYDQPYRRRELTYQMIKDLLETLQREQPQLSPHYVWEAYTQLANSSEHNTKIAPSPKNALVALVSLILK